VNWFEKHLGDWAKKTGHLSMLEEGAYNRMVDWCYAHEKPLPLPEKDVLKCARVRSPAEKAATLRVLHEFFVLMEDGWHQTRVDRRIAEFVKTRPASAEAKLAQNERKKRSRERRAALFEALRNAGLSPLWNATNRELLDMFEEYEVTLPVTAPVTATSHGMESRDGPGAQFPLPNNAAAVTGHGSRTVTEVTATRAGQACKAMRRAGLPDANPSHPLLLRLLEGGATDEELSTAAAEASARRKPFVYALGIVEGRRRDAAALGPVAPATQRESAASALMREFVPRVASGNGGPT
jgi:uncharacterized protein YdaU (DUF1376 family)